MEADKDALKLTKLLQEATRELIRIRYGEIYKDKNYRVRLELEFQSSIPGELQYYGTLLAVACVKYSVTSQTSYYRQISKRMERREVS